MTLLSPRTRLYLSLAWRYLPRAPLPVLWNFLLYKFFSGLGWSRLVYRPVNALIWASARCNKACSFCHYRGELAGLADRQSDLTLDRFHRLLDSPLVSRCLRLSFYGGEPLLNPRLGAMIEAARQRGHLVTVNTNGRLLARQRRMLMEHPPDLLLVSYYPEDAAYLRKALPELAPHMFIKLGALVFPGTGFRARPVVEFALEVGAGAVFFDPVVPNGYEEAPAWLNAGGEPVVDRPQVEQAYGDAITIIWPEPLSGERIRCRELWTTTVIDPEGRVGPCCVARRSAYDRAEGRQDPWNSPLAKRRRALMKAGSPPDFCQGCSFLHRDVLGL